MKYSSYHVVNYAGNTKEATLGSGMICINDKTQNYDQTCEDSFDDCNFHKVKEAAEEDDDECLYDTTDSLVHASVDIHKHTESSMHHQHVEPSFERIYPSISDSKVLNKENYFL